MGYRDSSTWLSFSFLMLYVSRFVHELVDDDSDDDTQMNVDGRRDDDEITYIAWLGGAEPLCLALLGGS